MKIIKNNLINDFILGMPNMKNILLLVLFASCLSAVVSADENEKPHVEAYLGIERYSFDVDRDLESAFSKSGGLEVALNNYFSVETWLSDYTAEFKDESDEIDASRFYGGALLHLKKRGKKRPFIVLGYSHLAYENNTGHKSSESLFSFGVGLKRYYSNNVILRGELMMMNSIDREVIDMGGRLSIGYAFKTSKLKPVYLPEPEPEPEPKIEPIVEQKVEPVQVEEVISEPEPEVVTVLEAPAPVLLDTDQDGVTDNIDLCANTNQAFKVDDTGCPVMLTENVSITVDIKFVSNSAKLPEESLPEVKKVADFMTQFDDIVLTVTGHTDDRGAADYNKSLSQRRADAVRLSLINTFGLSEDRVSAIGYGEEQPVADNEALEGRAINRRVVAVVESSIKKEAIR
jgi:OOP family OmpA-OmpF porin